VSVLSIRDAQPFKNQKNKTKKNPPGFLNFFIFYFCYYWGLNSGLHACKGGPLLFELHPQSILFWLFWRWDLTYSLPRLALNHDSPDLNLPHRARIIGVSHCAQHSPPRFEALLAPHILDNLCSNCVLILSLRVL
jgi:hypothetical protein